MPLPFYSSTEELALAASAGDMEALGLLCERFYDPLLRYLAARAGRDQILAEDVAQSAWEKVAAKIGRYRARGAGFEAWLWTIARNELAGHYRRIGRKPEQLTGDSLAIGRAHNGDTPEEALDRKFLAERLVYEVGRLTRAQRDCLRYRVDAQMDIASTAALMGLSSNAVKQLQYRALNRLAKALGDTLHDLHGRGPTSTRRSDLPSAAAAIMGPHPLALIASTE